MNPQLKHVLTIVLPSLVLAACEGTVGTKEDEKQPAVEAVVEDRSVGTSGPSDSGARAQGLKGATGFKGHPLDDPASPLSTRVVYFDFDSSDIKQEYRAVLEAHAGYLGNNPAATVTLEGHADERGSREYNIGLGEERANTVRRLMGLLGASDQQLRTVSYGEERPAAQGHEESAWQLNRRVEIDYRSR